MKVYLKKDVEKIGLSGEVITVSDGFARNLLIPRGLAVEITSGNQEFYQTRARQVKQREKVIENETSMLAEKISSLKIKLHHKMHDDGKLYGAVNASEVVEALADHGIQVSKNQVIFEKSIKKKGSYPVTIKLSSRLKPKVTVTVLSD